MKFGLASSYGGIGGLIVLTALTLMAGHASAVRSSCDSPVDDKIHVCQPNEYQGSYGEREWTVDRGWVCGHLNQCVNLDDMRCSNNDKCLKWGYHSYAGQANVPEGVKMSKYRSYQCGSGKGTSHGPIRDNFWDWHDRVSSFKFNLEDGFECTDGRIHSKCEVDGVSGYWEYAFTIQEGSTVQKTSKVGVESTESYVSSLTFQKSFEASIDSAFTFKGIDLGTTTAASQSSTLAETSTSALRKGTLEETTNTYTRPGNYYQFVEKWSGSGCGSAGTVYTEGYMIVSNVGDGEPCCLPGRFFDYNNPHGQCLDPEFCSCDAATCNQVELCRNFGCGDGSYRASVGDWPWMPSDFNDAVSEVVIPRGLSIEYFEHWNYGGYHRAHGSMTADMTLQMGSVETGYNDRVSSFRVREIPSGLVKLCRSDDCSSNYHETGVGSYPYMPPSVGNDQLRKIIIPPGFEVTCYEHYNFEGWKQSFKATGVASQNFTLTGDNVKTSSYIVSVL